MDLAVCTVDATELRVQDKRKGDERGPLLVCPACSLRFVITNSTGPQRVPEEPTGSG